LHSEAHSQTDADRKPASDAVGDTAVGAEDPGSICEEGPLQGGRWTNRPLKEMAWSEHRKTHVEPVDVKEPAEAESSAEHHAGRVGRVGRYEALPLRPGDVQLRVRVDEAEASFEEASALRVSEGSPRGKPCGVVIRRGKVAWPRSVGAS